MNKRNKTKKFRRKIKGGSDNISPGNLDTKSNGVHASNVVNVNNKMSDDLVKLFFKCPFLITDYNQNKIVQMTVDENSLLEEIFTNFLSIMKQPKMSTTDFKIIKDLRLAGFIYEDLTNGYVRPWSPFREKSITHANFWRGINKIYQGTLSDIEFSKVKILIGSRLTSTNALFDVKVLNPLKKIMTPEKYAEMLTSDSSN